MFRHDVPSCLSQWGGFHSAPRWLLWRWWPPYGTCCWNPERNLQICLVLELSSPKTYFGHWGSSSHFDACIWDMFETTTFSALKKTRHLYWIRIRKRPGCLKPPTSFWKGSNDNAQRRCCGCWPRSARPLASFPPGLHQNRPKRRSTACSLSWVIAIAYSKCAWKTCSSATKILVGIDQTYVSI